jgi:hypothetical protein
MKIVPHESKVAADFAEPASWERDILFLPTGLGVLALLAAVLGRGLSTALPGAVVGFDAAVNAVLTLGAFASQLFAIAGAVVSLRLALWLATHRGLPFSLKTCLAAASLFVCLVVFFSAQPRLFIVGPLVLGMCSFGSAGLLLWSALTCAIDRGARAVSLLGWLAALTAVFHTAARLVALAASNDGNGLQYDVARALATLASGLDAALLSMGGLWLWPRVHAATKAWCAVALACIPAIFIGSPHSGPRYVLQRMADALTSHPDPFLPLFVQWGLELTALTFSVVCLTDRGPSRLTRLTLAFALLGRTTSDRPLGALLLVLSALCILLPLATGPMSGAAKLLGGGTAAPPTGPISA